MPLFDAQITFCATRDLKSTASFYEDVLGLPLILDQGGCRIYEVADGGYLGFCQKDDAPEPDGVVLTLVVDDVDGWHTRLSQAGAAIENPPKHNDQYRIYHFYLRDPSGHLLEIQRFEDPRWPGHDGGKA